MDAKSAVSFLELPPPETEGYYDIIKHPIALEVVATKLREGQYRSARQVAKEVVQVWANCRMYNQAGSAIVKLCGQAEKVFATAWHKADLPGL